MSNPKNLLIVRTDRLGDVVLSLPLAGIIKNHFPDCKITYLIRGYTRDLLTGHKYIDNVMTIEEVKGKPIFFSNRKNISKNKFDYAIISYPDFLIALIIFFSGISNRIGTGFRWYSFLFNKRVFVHRKYASKHEAEFNVDLLKELNIHEEISPSHVSFDLPLTDNDKIEAKEFLLRSGIKKDRPIIIIHPGSGNSSVDLPKEKFKELINLINSNLDAQIIITGSKDEKDLCNELVISDKIKNFAGYFSLRQLTAIINECDIFISNSTGPLHIATALGKNVLGFYPKILSCSAKRWGPYSDRSTVFVPEINCESCTVEKCIKLNCMSSINIADVFANIFNIFESIVKNGDNNA